MMPGIALGRMTTSLATPEQVVVLAAPDGCAVPRGAPGSGGITVTLTWGVTNRIEGMG